MKNTRLNVRVDSSIYDMLDDFASSNNLTKSKIMTEALKEYIAKGEVPELDENEITLNEMKNELAFVKKRLGYIEKELQQLIEVANSVLTLNKINDSNFVNTDSYENGLMKVSREYVSERIRKRKQDSDFKKYK